MLSSVPLVEGGPLEEATKAVRARTQEIRKQIDRSREQEAKWTLLIIKEELSDYASSKGYDKATGAERYPDRLFPDMLVGFSLRLDKGGMSATSESYRFIYMPSDDLASYSLRAEPIPQGTSQRIIQANPEGYTFLEQRDGRKQR
jgi:hypothetical protein